MEFKSNVETSDKPTELTFRDLIHAQLEGKTVQYFYENSWMDYKLVVRIDVASLDTFADSSHRIKPEAERFCNGVELDVCIIEE